MNVSSKGSVEPKSSPFTAMFHKLMEAIGTPSALRAHLLMRSGEPSDLLQLVSSAINPLHYREGDEGRFAYDYLVQKIASKLPEEFSSWNKLEPTLKQFCDQEDHCRSMNHRVWSGQFDQDLLDHGLTISAVRRLFRQVLGRAPTLRQVCLSGGWGPGSTATASRAESIPEAKCSDLSVTYRLARALQDADCHNLFPWWSEPWVLVPGNVMFTVTKNAKTLRTASAEPTINGWVQKGIGVHIRAALKGLGIDLNDQTINQSLACSAQRYGYCTLDLRGASNSQALALILHCLPRDWAELLELARSERGTLDNRTEPNKAWFEYEMISSMGNGFTFELESLLFYCICRFAGCNSNDIWIYGDDIIVPQRQANSVVTWLTMFGFSLNREKSFTSGLFFESCGAHVFNGCDVTPFYIEDLLYEPSDVLRTANELRLFGTRLDLCGIPHRQLLPVYRYLVGRLPTAFKSKGPAGGGLCLFSNTEEFAQRSSRYVGRLEYNHLTPVFDYYIPEKGKVPKNTFIDTYHDCVVGPMHPTKGGNNIRSLERKWRRAVKRGLGETPWLSQYRIFQLGIGSKTHPWLDPLSLEETASAGNRVARVKLATWTKDHLERMSQHDRNRSGTLAHNIVTGFVNPEMVPTLTNWSH